MFRVGGGGECQKMIVNMYLSTQSSYPNTNFNGVLQLSLRCILMTFHTSQTTVRRPLNIHSFGGRSLRIMLMLALEVLFGQKYSSTQTGFQLRQLKKNYRVSVKNNLVIINEETEPLEIFLAGIRFFKVSGLRGRIFK